MKLFINALAATAGGGVTYIRNVVPELAARPSISVVLLAPSALRELLPPLKNVEFMDQGQPSSTVQRFWWEQRKLPVLVRESGADVLISAGNFALRRSPVPQILLSRNSLYTSSDFMKDLQRRQEYRMLLDAKIRGVLAKASVGWSDRTVAPSNSFAEELRHWTRKPVEAIYHGFDRRSFADNAKPLPPDVQAQLESVKNCYKLLFVSHYNYYRNFETLFRALPILRNKLAQRPIKLILTCKLEPDQNPGVYKTEAAARLVRELGIGNDILQLGRVPYVSLANLYKACEVYVTAAYAETFAHPLVEAMSVGLPIVASERPVHREICRDAAVFFPTFSPEILSQRVFEIANDAHQTERLRRSGLARSQQFSWQTHVTELLHLAERLTNRPEARAGDTILSS